MKYIQLSRSASITPTEAGLLMRSDLGTFRIDGPDLSAFVAKMLPMLDGTRDRDRVASALSEYSRESVLALIELLEQRGLVEMVSEATMAVEQARWRGQEEFFRKWTDRSDTAWRRLSEARVLIVGLEPWGVLVAIELAAAGVGALHLVDESAVTPDDLLSVRLWSNRHLGLPRFQAVIDVLSQIAPWCKVTGGSLTLTDEPSLALDDTTWTLIISTVTADDLRVLQSVARFAHRAGVMSLSGNFDGIDAVLGPVVVPGETACWNCFRLRHLANSNLPADAHALQTALLTARPQPRTRTYLSPMAPMLGHLLALEALKLISQYTPSFLIGRLLVQNMNSLETSTHTVIRMPWCEVCGGAARGNPPSGGPRIPDPSRQESQTSHPQRLDRASSPEELRQALAGWVDERVGVVRQLMIDNHDAMEPEIPITSTALLSKYTEGSYWSHGVSVGSGKGLSAVEALISGVGEAIERYSASRYRKSDMLRSAMNDLPEDCIDPRRLCLYEGWQYEQAGFPCVPFRPDRPIDWTRGYWFDTGELVWLPALLTHLDFQVPPEEYFCQASSNGLAAGADRDDAALRAVFELVERDAFMISWLCQRPGLKVRVDDTLDAGVREIIRQLEGAGCSVELYLLNVGIAIPTITCFGIGDGKQWPALTVSLAAHASPRIGCRKAILEQGHVSPFIRRLMVEGSMHIPAQPDEVVSLEDHALYYTSIERLPILDFMRGSTESVSLSDLEEPSEITVQTCAKHLAEAGVRVAIADVTSPDVATSPFRVARAVGIDMQPIDFGYKLRRLANPRMKAMLTGPINPNPHPLA